MFIDSAKMVHVAISIKLILFTFTSILSISIMNLQQLEYIIAVDAHRHFVTAAEKCYVTQATLSMMIKKLEEELGIRIFDRRKQPVVPTPEGEAIIAHARRVVAEAENLTAFAAELKNIISGTVKIGVIPTLAPYLIPLFLKPLSDKHPNLKIVIRELVTEDLISALKTGLVDMGIAAAPIADDLLKETPLFYEPFYVYASKGEKLPAKKYLLPNHINPQHLWLLEEGHCLRSQVLDLCTLQKASAQPGINFQYEAGSIATLINIVDTSGGLTIIPKLAAIGLSSQQKKCIRAFAKPVPGREICLITDKTFPRKKLLASVGDVIQQQVAEGIARHIDV